MSFTLTNLVDSITLGSLYALIAVGYTMVYGIVKLINFAHGEIFMLGAFWALLIVGDPSEATGFNLFVAIVPAMLLCAGVGLAIDWTAYLSLRRKLPLADALSVVLLVLLSVGAIAYNLTGSVGHPWESESTHTVIRYAILVLVPLAMLAAAMGEKVGWLGRSLGRVESHRLCALITAIGMSLILQTLALLVWGADYQTFHPDAIPAFMNEPVLGIEMLRWKSFVIWIVALLMMVGLHFLVSRTRIGTAMRACSIDKETASLMGISVDRVIAFTFLVGSAMAAVAGILYAAKVGGNIAFRMGYYPGLIAFAAAVLGGIGSIKGAMLGGMVIGFVQGFTGGTFLEPFLVMILVLLVRPHGIFAQREVKRA